MLFAQGEAPGYIAAMALAFWAVFPSACAVASGLPHALWDTAKEAGGFLLYDLARPVAVSSLCFMPAISCNTIGASLVSAPSAGNAWTALVASGNTTAGAPSQHVMCRRLVRGVSPRALVSSSRANVLAAVSLAISREQYALCREPLCVWG